MERHQYGDEQRHGGITARGAVIVGGWALLGLGLAASTYVQTGVWQSEQTLWTQAHRVEPSAPRPLIGLAWVAMGQQDYATASDLLVQALGVLKAPFSKEHEWAIDAIEATQATIDLAQGRLTTAALRMAHAPWYSERTALCHRYPSVCALADSPSSP